MTIAVVFSVDGKSDFDSLPVVIKARVLTIIERLANWPAVSGAKPMRGALKGHYRVRTGDYRVLFTVTDSVIIVRIAHRSTVYED